MTMHVGWLAVWVMGAQSTSDVVLRMTVRPVCWAVLIYQLSPPKTVLVWMTTYLDYSAEVSVNIFFLLNKNILMKK